MTDGIGRASAFLASGTIVSRILGFVKAIIVAATIGVVGSAGADAFAVANGLPNTVYVIVAGGVLSAVLVPQIVRAGAHADGGSAYINKDRKSTRLNSSHGYISYAVFCLKKKKNIKQIQRQYV